MVMRDPFRNYDAWKTTPPEDEPDEHGEGCCCRECDPDLERDRLMDLEAFDLLDESW